MENYKRYSVEYLINNDSFRDWVFDKNLENTNWGDVYVNSPENQEVIEQARAFLLATKGEVLAISQNEAESAINSILEKVENQSSQPSTLKIISKNLWFRAAAAVLIMASIGFWFWNKQANPSVITYHDLVEKSDDKLVEIINDGDKPRLVNLQDGSSVILQKNSRISFAKVFSKEKREVYLSGEAFFEVAKNPAQPFFVYANELIAKVLGTSFSVRAYETDKEVKVVVKTGKVSVFSQKDNKTIELRNNRELAGIVITPNQQVVFQREEVRILREIVETPALLNLPIEQQNFVFKRTPISEVFMMLEKAYGVDIVYDEEVLSKCSITASLADEPLFEKLKMICTAINANYEEIDGQIVITAEGCE
jgi:transmembrane sensor